MSGWMFCVIMLRVGHSESTDPLKPIAQKVFAMLNRTVPKGILLSLFLGHCASPPI